VPTHSLSVIIPVRNGQGWIARCIERVAAAIEVSDFAQAEFIVVDDGSTDGTVREAKAVDLSRLGIEVRVVSQHHAGRLRARRAGLEAAHHEVVLFIDVRVHLDPGSLAFVVPFLDDPDTAVWTAHVDANTERSRIAGFWQAIEHAAWRRYFRSPRQLSFRIDEFDYYPKGTTALLGPRALFLDAFEAYEPTVDDWHISNDDTAVLRWVARHRPINIAPNYRALYNSRTTVREFLAHARHRGAVLIDGYFRPGARFSGAIAVVLASTPLIVIGAVARPRAIVPCAVAYSVAAGVAVRAAGARSDDAATVGILALPFSVSYLFGMWRGLAAKVRARRGVPAEAGS
jgi:glycosyltransferase involved in cell wall biosynthesis